MAVTKLIKKERILDRDYFIKKAFGILKTDFGSKASLAYVRKIRRNWRQKNSNR